MKNRGNRNAFLRNIFLNVWIIKVVLSLSYFKRYFNFIIKKMMTFYSLFFHKAGTMLLFAEEGGSCNKSSVCSRVRNELHWRWVGFPGSSAQYFILASLRLVQIFISSCTLCWCKYQVVCYWRERSRKCNLIFYFMLPKFTQTDTPRVNVCCTQLEDLVL